MSLGERGGRTATLEAGIDLIEIHKGELAAAVRADILRHLESHVEWHRDDLTVHLPADSKNVLGAVVNGLVRSGRIVETGERRRSAEPAAHGRRSSVYRRGGDGRPQSGASVGRPAVISPSGDGGGNGLDEPVPAPLFVLDPDPPKRPGFYDREVE